MNTTSEKLNTISDKLTQFEKAVLNMLADSGEIPLAVRLKDILEHGCESGMISDLVYYQDTCAFYKKYINAINVILADAITSCGYDGPAVVFGDKWDNSDPLALDTNNQNLLAWFGFECASANIAAQLENEEQLSNQAFWEK